MLPILTSLIPTNLLTYLKIGAIIFVIATSNYITWNFAQRQMDKERLSIAQSALLAEKNNTSYWVSQLEESRKLAIKAQERNVILDNKITKLMKEHSNAPPLPNDCVIDDAGVRLLQDAREAAISSTTSISNN